MMRFIACLVLFIWWFPEPIDSATAQDPWRIPGGDVFETTFRNGDSIPLLWEGWGSSWLDTYLDGENINDLWVTSYDYNIAPFDRLVTSMLVHYEKHLSPKVKHS